VKPGDTLTVELTNSLTPEGFDTASLHNDYRTIDTTNLHTHGLHISGEEPGDSIFVEVEPGETHTYTYVIPSDHMGGTFWYHPHRHTLTNLQLSGGAFGMLIIEEQEDLLKSLTRREQRRVSAWLEKELLLLAFVTGDTEGEVLGNGKPQADFRIVQGQWYRLRVAAIRPSANTRNLVIHPSGSLCSAHVVAYDGVWRFTAPRLESRFEYPLTGASRIDLAIRCSGTQAVNITFDDDVVAVLHVARGKATKATPFASGHRQWRPSRPDYLPDLRSLPGANEFAIRMDGCRLVNGVPKCFINNTEWDKDVPIGDFEFDTLQEWRLIGTDQHPFHLHIYHQQIVRDCGTRHEIGQYYDTVSSSEAGKDCVVRFLTKDFSGRVVFHCHITRHSDFGMMSWMNVVGGPDPGNIDVGQVSCSTVAAPCQETGARCGQRTHCCKGQCRRFKCV